MRCASLREGSFYLKIHRDVKYYQHINVSTLHYTPFHNYPQPVHNSVDTLWICSGHHYAHLCKQQQKSIRPGGCFPLSASFSPKPVHLASL